MDFLEHNWFYILVLALFVGMHLTGFGCGHRWRRIHKTVAGRHTAPKRAAGVVTVTPVIRTRNR